MLSQRVRRIGLSPTLRISGMAQELRAAGVDVLDFSAGQPDFPTPQAVKQAGRQAIDQDRTRYTPNAGIPELRRAIAETLERDGRLQVAPEQILVSSGAKASLYFAFLALLDPGDDVLVPQPYWVSYPEQVALADARAVVVPCSERSGFKLTAEQLAHALTPRTRALILNYPGNPSGACYGRDELAPLAEFCLRHDVWIIADEIYSRLVYDAREFTSIASLGPEIAKRTVVIDGMSKSYSMTGWRIGYAAGPADVIAAMARLQSHATSNACSVSQWASVEALHSADDEVRRRVAEFERRRDVMVDALGQLDGVSCVKPEGAFYAFPNFAQRCRTGTLTDGDAVAQYLLETARVAVVPGGAFGAPSHVRFSYAASVERIREGMTRVAEALTSLG